MYDTFFCVIKKCSLHFSDLSTSSCNISPLKNDTSINEYVRVNSWIPMRLRLLFFWYLSWCLLEKCRLDKWAISSCQIGHDWCKPCDIIIHQIANRFAFAVSSCTLLFPSSTSLRWSIFLRLRSEATIERHCSAVWRVLQLPLWNLKHQQLLSCLNILYKAEHCYRGWLDTMSAVWRYIILSSVLIYSWVKCVFCLFLPPVWVSSMMKWCRTGTRIVALLCVLQ